MKYCRTFDNRTFDNRLHLFWTKGRLNLKKTFLFKRDNTLPLVDIDIGKKFLLDTVQTATTLPRKRASDHIYPT